jgi:hypothetical protein
MTNECSSYFLVPQSITGFDAVFGSFGTTETLPTSLLRSICTNTVFPLLGFEHTLSGVQVEQASKPRTVFKPSPVSKRNAG